MGQAAGFGGSSTSCVVLAALFVTGVSVGSLAGPASPRRAALGAHSRRGSSGDARLPLWRRALHPRPLSLFARPRARRGRPSARLRWSDWPRRGDPASANKPILKIPFHRPRCQLLARLVRPGLVWAVVGGAGQDADRLRRRRQTSRGREQLFGRPVSSRHAGDGWSRTGRPLRDNHHAGWGWRRWLHDRGGDWLARASSGARIPALHFTISSSVASGCSTPTSLLAVPHRGRGTGRRRYLLAASLRGGWQSSALNNYFTFAMPSC